MAGDTVYLKGGTYTINDATYGRYSGAIMPSHSGTGTGTGRIIYAAAPGENPILSQSSGSMIAGVFLGGVVTNNYIKIDGITFKNNSYYMGYITNYSSHNEITNCTFARDPGATEVGSAFIIRGGLCSPNYNCWATHNWIHENTFSRSRPADPCAESVDLLTIGGAYSPTYGNQTDCSDNYNTVEDNYFEYAAHTPIDTYSRYNVIKNNIIHNEPWITGCVGSRFIPTYVNSSYDGKYGHRMMQLSDDFGYPMTYLLIEGNRLGHASTNPGNAGPMSLDVAAPKNIIRYNFLYNGMQSGIYFKYANLDPSLHTGGPGGINNRIYNNTVYHTGYGYDWIKYGGGNYSGHGIAQWNYTSAPTLNVVKNNIVYDSSNGDICSLWTAAPCSPTIDDMITNNWLTASGDPKFANTDLTQTSSRTLPNLSLQSTSPAINGGTYLTQTSGSGSNSTILVVQDALYFQDGTWGSDLARGVTLFPDWIAIGTVSNVVQISSINYSTNTITLASPMTWSSGANIWLYKKSDGAQVLYGSAPDYGAYEYAAAAPPSDITPPAAPTGVTVN